MNTNGMKAFEPPKEIEEVRIFADNDRNYAGHQAAYSLANKLSLSGVKAEVFVPESPGQDWLNVYNSKNRRD